jgi:hypothetical protein
MPSTEPPPFKACLWAAVGELEVQLQLELEGGAGGVGGGEVGVMDIDSEMVGLVDMREMKDGIDYEALMLLVHEGMAWAMPSCTRSWSRGLIIYSSCS